MNNIEEFTDAFGEVIEVGNTVIYSPSTKDSSYFIGEIKAFTEQRYNTWVKYFALVEVRKSSGTITQKKRRVPIKRLVKIPIDPS